MVQVILTIGAVIGLVGIADVLFFKGQIGVTLAKFIGRA